MLIIFSIISTLFSASLTMSMSFVEAEVDYAGNDSVKESLADDEDDNSLYHYKKKNRFFSHLCPCSCKLKPVQIILQHLSYLF